MNPNIFKSTKLLIGAGLAVMTGAFGVSCVEMDLESHSQLSSKTIWTDPVSAEGAIVSCYSSFKSLYNDPANLWPETMGSQMDRDPNWFSIGMLKGTQSIQDSNIHKYWSWYYHYIFQCNDVIQHMPQVPGMEEALRARLIAEARWIRCYYYYQLNCVYGGVPWYENIVESIEEAQMPRGTQDETFQLIIDDLSKAIDEEAFPLKYAQGSANHGRATKGAAYMLRGKCYMWLKKWQEAADDFEEVEKCGYKLYEKGDTPYKDLFLTENEDCDEMIFSVMCDLVNDWWGDRRQRGYGTREATGWGWSNYVPNPRFVDSYENADGTPFNWNDVIPGYNEMSPKARRVFFLRNDMTDAEKTFQAEAGADMSFYLPKDNEARILKAYENRDPRLAMSIITPYSTFLGGSAGVARYFTSRFPFRNHAKKPFDLRIDTADKFYYFVRKFVTEGLEHADHLGCNDIDIPLMRFGETLLCLAECYNELNRLDDAVATVNRIRRRAGAIELNTTAPTMVKGKEDMRIRLRNEFKWELFAEDIVYMHELRWRTWKDDKFYVTKEGEVNGMCQVWGEFIYHYSWGGDHYWLYPIPNDERVKNHKLTQNPGW